MVRTSLFAALAFALAGAATGQEFTAAQGIDKIVSVSGPDGSVSLDYQSADRVAPGDTLFYHIDYNNGSSDPAENVQLVMVVPPEVSYLENTADAGSVNASVAFSADNGENFYPRNELQVASNGASRLAAPDDITHIRWTFNDPVPPQSAGLISFRATVR